MLIRTLLYSQNEFFFHKLLETVGEFPEVYRIIGRMSYEGCFFESSHIPKAFAQFFLMFGNSLEDCYRLSAKSMFS